MIFNDLLQSQRLRAPVRHGQHIDAEGVFQAGLLVEHIFQILHIRPALQLQNDADPLFGRLIGYVNDIRGLLRFDQRSHVIEELADAASDHRVGDLTDHQLFLPAF